MADTTAPDADELEVSRRPPWLLLRSWEGLGGGVAAACCERPPT